MRPLQGQRVIDLTQNVAGPTCTQLLADLGAEVIKIERPGAGDDTRHWAPLMGAGMSPTYATLNRGKASLALDLDRPEGQALLRRLLRPDDIVIHSLKPGSAERRGLGHEQLSATLPRLIYCAISAFGNLGPLKQFPGYDPLIQAYSGLMTVTGHEDAAPVRVGVSMVDIGTGMWAAMGILSAVIGRATSGRGCCVDTSLLETGLGWMANAVALHSVTGRLPQRWGSGTAVMAPYEVVDAKDGPVFIGCGNDRLFVKLAAALEAPHLPLDPRFATNAERVAHRTALREALEQVTRTLTRAAISDRLQAAGVPVSPVHALPEVLAQPQVQALDMTRPLDVRCAEGAAEVTAVGVPLRFDGRRPYAAELSSGVGEDTVRVLSAAGLSDSEIDQLRATAVIAA